MNEDVIDLTIKAGKKFHCLLEDGTEAFLKCMQNIDAESLLKIADENFVNIFVEEKL